MRQSIISPLSNDIIQTLKAGQNVLLSGYVYTGRDAAHKRLTELLASDALPFDIRGQTIYYTGPCPPPPGKIIGSAGPTTSLRMDAYSPILIKEGLRVMIGKGAVSDTVKDAIRQYRGLYLTAVGGAGALLSACVKRVELIAFADLGTEAIYKLTVTDMPLIVAVDSKGFHAIQDVGITYKGHKQI